MAKIKVYNIPIDEVVLYHNMVGCYSPKDDKSKLKTKVSKFKELSPFTKKQVLSPSIRFIDFHARYLIERLNTEFDDSFIGKIEKIVYKNAYLGIIGTVLSINMIDNEDYETLYERTNTILGTVLSSLNNMEINDVILLYEAIKQEDKEAIEEYKSKKSTLTQLILLSMIDEDLPDYQIFLNDNELDLDKLYCMVEKNKNKRIKLQVDKYSLRPSYKDIKSM